MADGAKTKTADAQFRKLQRVADGKRAMSDYETSQAAGYARTAKLKAERLAREAALAAAAPPPVAKPPARKTAVRKAAAVKTPAAKVPQS